MPMLISDDPRARSYAKREYRRGWYHGFIIAMLVAILILTFVRG